MTATGFVCDERYFWVEQGQSGHCHVKRSDFERHFNVACRDANHLLHTPSIST
mgnify:CR=1 FL=1|jgi:hypothetical protein